MEYNDHNPELIQKFIEAYNRCVDWNRELCTNPAIGIAREHPCTRQILDDFVNLEYITPETYDLDNAKIYPCDTPDKYEFQAYSRECYCTSYFWVNLKDTKDEYINRRIQLIRRETADTIARFRPELEKLQSNVTALENLQNALNQ